MSDLVAIAYPDEAAARRAHANLAEHIEKGVLEVEDAVVIAWDDEGRILPILGGLQVGVAASGGAIAGGLIGLLLLGPLLGMAVGGAMAARAQWKRSFGDAGISERFIYELWENLPEGSAALVILVRSMALEQILPNLREPGRTIQTSLGADVEAQLDAALSAAHENKAKE